MKRVEAPCPSCGATIEFKINSSLVTVCDHCQTVVARGDRELESFGKVAAIAPTGTKLYLGAEGVYRNKSFEIVGHVQYQHAGGGSWDEWYASFAGDRWAWFSEAQGKMYFLRHRQLKGDPSLPDFEQLRVGERLEISGIEPLTVSETGTATVGGAAGELPFPVVSGAAHRYADLVGASRAFATIEYDKPDGNRICVGSEVTLTDLDLAPFDGAMDAEVLEIAAIKVDCPNCGGSLDLHAPDQSERVICPYCNGVLDASHGRLQYLHTLTVNKKIQPVIPIGSTGNLQGTDYTVIGFMQRSVTFDRDYFWTEYLLYNASAGFRWLVHSDDHWSFVESISVAEVRYSLGSRYSEYKGEHFKLFQMADATVRYVLGEFYWKVAVGEKVNAMDFVAPPKMISIERTKLGEKASQGQSDEIQCSLGTYLPHAELERAFKITNLRRGWGVAPNQPIPYKLAPLWLSWIGFVCVLTLFNIIASLGLSFGTPDIGWYWFCLALLTLLPAGASFYRYNFEVQRWKDSDYSPYNNG